MELMRKKSQADYRNRMKGTREHLVSWGGFIGGRVSHIWKENHRPAADLSSEERDEKRLYRSPCWLLG